MSETVELWKDASDNIVCIYSLMCGISAFMTNIVQSIGYTDVYKTSICTVQEVDTCSLYTCKFLHTL